MLLIENKWLGLAAHAFALLLIWTVYMGLFSIAAPIPVSVLVATIHTFFWGLLYSGTFAVIQKVRKGANPYLWYGGIILVLILSIFIKVIVNQYYVDHIHSFSEELVNQFRERQAIPVANSLAPFLGAFLYAGVYRRHQKEKRNMALLNEYQRSQLQYLKAQINPHFLFNTLHNIYSLSVTNSPMTSEMVLKLSDLLRYAIYEGEKENVPLRKEIEHARILIELFQMRSRKNLDIQLEVKGEPEGVFIEPMLLIPLVENALKHGDMGRNPAGFAKFILSVENGEIKFEAENSYTPNPQKDEVGGVGLENIKKRLAIGRPNKHKFEILDRPPLFAVNIAFKHGY